ncbi:MAG: IclR family transcriptional regulator [Candidatus Saccharibacteria bacterium]|nr:IclR family transcriptional regulator [Microbacteriaceae bacterium]
MTLTPARPVVATDTASSTANTPSPAAFRAGLILSHMGDRRVPLTISDIAIHLDLAKSSVFNLLVSLEASHMVRRGEHGWVLSYRMLELSRSMLASSTMVAEFGHIPRALTTLHSETTLLAVLDGTDVIYLARNGGTQPVRFLAAVGSRAPAGVTGLGKAVLASLSDLELDTRLASIGELPRPTVRSHRSVEALHNDLMQIRERGYAVDDEQGVVGVTCVAVAFVAEGMPAAVSATLLAPRATSDMRSRLASELSILARGLSDQEQL